VKNSTTVIIKSCVSTDKLFTQKILIKQLVNYQNHAKILGQKLVGGWVAGMASGMAGGWVELSVTVQDDWPKEEEAIKNQAACGICATLTVQEVNNNDCSCCFTAPYNCINIVVNCGIYAE